MATNTTDLPSKVEESLAVCPQFRILVVGKSGVGKSSLISCVFNMNLKGIDIAHNRAGKANVEIPYTSDDNPRFILHDSQGFEPGNTSNWGIVEKFLLARGEVAELKDRVHAIWLCIETPRTGGRVEQTGDENLLSLAKKLKIPIIAVFTKFDLLVNEHLAKAQKPRFRKLAREKTPAETAEEDFKKRIESVCLQKQIQCVRISTMRDRLGTLRELTDTTRRSLRGVEGELWVPWAAAQQVSARQKVDESIRSRAVKGQYWIDLGQSSVFRSHILIDCLSRIFQDVLKIWNFNDPNNLLSAPEFFAKTIQLVEEFSPNSPENDQDDRLSQYSDVASLASAVGTVFAQVVGGVGIGLLAMKYLHRTYRAVPATAQYLGAYIIDLTLVLHHIFMTTLVQEPPRILSKGVIDDEMRTYAESEAPRIHRHIRDMDRNPAGFEQKIAELIRESLGLNQADMV